jgi:Domain of unknown function (DUF4490)
MNVLVAWNYKIKQQHRLYSTTTNQYGQQRPTVHDMPTVFKGQKSTFTEVILSHCVGLPNWYSYNVHSISTWLVRTETFLWTFNPTIIIIAMDERNGEEYYDALDEEESIELNLWNVLMRLVCNESSLTKTMGSILTLTWICYQNEWKDIAELPMIWSIQLSYYTPMTKGFHPQDVNYWGWGGVELVYYRSFYSRTHRTCPHRPFHIWSFRLLACILSSSMLL